MAASARDAGRRTRVALVAALTLGSPAAAAQPGWPPHTSPDAIYDVVEASLLPLPAPALALRLVDDSRLLILHANALALYRLTRDRLAPVDRFDLPAQTAVMRHPAGLLLRPGGEPVFWVLVAGRPPALLVDAGRDRLLERSRAEALPWPGAARGLQYRPGTDWLEGQVDGLGPGPFLALEAASTPALAVDAEASLLLAAVGGPLEAGVRSGPALAVLDGPRRVAVASAAPPGETDRVFFLALAAGTARPSGELTVPGAVRALCAASSGRRLRLALALEDADGWRLALLTLRRRDELALP